MYMLFNFKDGSNPYICKDSKTAFSMFCKYETVQASEFGFFVIGLRKWNGKPSYNGKKEVARALAIDWQRDMEEYNYSMGELSDWAIFFEEIGKDYGLIREFKENGII